VEGRVDPRAAIVISIRAPALIETRDHTLTMARTFNGLRSPFLKERRRSYRTVSYRKSINNISKQKSINEAGKERNLQNSPVTK
jgi:hypothetical protein